MMKENKNLEFKSAVSNTFLKTVSAFANYEGGTIVFGVDDLGNPVGLKDIREQCLRIENTINDCITPQPDYELSIIHSGKAISLKVRQGYRKPYFYQSKAYKRNDTSTIEVDHLELKRLILEGDNLDFEELVSKRQDLTFTCLEKELKDKVGIEQMNQDVLRTLNLYQNEHGYNNAAEILSDQNPFSGIDIVKFGETINIFQKRIISEKKSILESFHEAMGMFSDYYQYEVVEGMERKKREKVPEEAFREAIANALVHRTWDINANITVFMFDDHIEITSVGGLPKGVSEEDYLEGRVSILRNPILANVLHRLNMMEKFGTGIRRIRESYANSKNKPSFEITDTRITILLPLLVKNLYLTNDEEIVYGALKENLSLPIGEVIQSDAIYFGKSKTTELLKALEKKGLITIEGRGKSTKYRIRK